MKCVKDLRGAVVVITGAGSGIGRATALAFAREGARLHLVDLDGAAAADAAREARDLGAEATAHQVDCTDAEAVERLAGVVYAADGRVDVLHNNAGVCCGGPVERISLEDWRWTIDVNLWGVIHGVRAFVPRMIAQGGGGHIVNTASMAGLVGLPMVSPYCASKFAVVGLSEALNAELGVHDIHVTAICPGATRTNVLENARLDLPGGLTERLTRSLEKCNCGPERIADLVVDAVRSRRSFVVTGIDMIPVWLLRRVSIRLYQKLSRSLTRLAARKLTGLRGETPA
jgi:NAD(P)-dependent dehydrogenase (short-subunit alcohol dehydrogenase family)